MDLNKYWVIRFIAPTMMRFRSAGLALISAPRFSAALSMSSHGSPSASLEKLAEWKAHGGLWTRFKHRSSFTGTPMTFSVFTPPGATVESPAPVLFYLSGLTCTDENVVQKAGASRAAAAFGVALVCPDTSPRGAGVVGEDESWDFGTGAGFYIDATSEAWATGGYKMESYVKTELRDLCSSAVDAIDATTASLTGHSMGGHGSLTLAFKDPSSWRSVSAFSPICHPTNCPWGKKAFDGYLAGGVAEGEQHDAVVLMRRLGSNPDLKKLPILVDQGAADSFYTSSESNGPSGQLQPEALIEAMKSVGRATDGENTRVRLQDGYDHTYFFISTFIDDHIEWHAKHLHSAR